MKNDTILIDFSLFLGVPYHITVHTGDKRNAGTDARVYVVMHRDNASSSQIFLSDGKFEAKSVDRFTVDGPDDLSPLTALDIGHDNSGMGPGWYLDKVGLSIEILLSRSNSSFSRGV